MKISQELGGERYIKKFDIWHHLNSMLYATISRLDSLREIEKAMIVESRKLSLLGLTTVVPCDIQFSSSATHDHFMLSPEKLTSQDIFVFDRAYILSYPYFRRRPYLGK